MDITLERILSLIPRKPDGKFVHGAKKEFCEKIGAPTNIVSEWESGKTKSYRNYIYAVSQVFGVSVEWLKGETDIKNPLAQKDEGLTDIQNEAMEFMRSLTDDQLRRFIAMGRAAFEEEGK